MESREGFTRVVRAGGASGHGLSRAAFAYFTGGPVVDVSAGRIRAAVAFDLFGLNVPFFGDGSLCGFIVVSGGDEGFAVGAGDAAEGNHFLHAETSLRDCAIADIKLASVLRYGVGLVGQIASCGKVSVRTGLCEGAGRAGLQNRACGT
jgi:hypothetical protein